MGLKKNPVRDFLKILDIAFTVITILENILFQFDLDLNFHVTEYSEEYSYINLKPLWTFIEYTTLTY